MNELANTDTLFEYQISDGRKLQHTPLEYLQGPERGLTMSTIVDRQLGWAPGGLQLYKHLRSEGFANKEITATGLVREQGDGIVDSLSGMVTIPYHTAGNVVQIRGRAWPYDGDGPKYKTCGGNKARLYNTDRTWDTKEIVITEGEFDAMMVEQLGYPAIGSPGANQWQDVWDGYVEDQRRIMLLFDRDAAGMQGAEKLRDRFGSRVREIHLSEPGIKMDPTSWVCDNGGNPDEFAALVEKGRSGGLLVTVDEALAEHTELQGLPGVKFGIEQLDVNIEPGLLDGQVAVVLAKSGTGKTISLLNMMETMRRVPGQEDLKFLFVSLEQTRGEWWERARRIHRFYNLDKTDEEVADWWRNNIMLVDKNRVSPDEFKTVLDDFEYQQGQLPDVTFIDYLGYWAQSFPGERYQRTSDAIMSLKELAKGTSSDDRLKIITPHQVSRVAKYGEEPDTDSARDAGVVEETADFLFTLWNPDSQLGRAEEEKSGLINMRIGKSRHGGKGTKIAYQFAPISLALVPHGEQQLTVRAKEELEYERLHHDSFEDVILRHQSGFDGRIDDDTRMRLLDEDF